MYLLHLLVILLLISIGNLNAQKLTVSQQDKIFAGVTLYPEEGSAQIKLLDIDGRILNTWNIDADRARLLPSGNILVIHGTKWGIKQNQLPWRKLRKFVREYDWQGKIVWEYEAEDIAHHDIRRLNNGNTLFIKRTIVPEEYQLRIIDPVRRMNKLRGDSIIEVDYKGQTIWEWHAHEHLDLNIPGSAGIADLTKSNGPKFRMHDWTHLNSVSAIPKNKWYVAGDTRFKPSNILIHARNWSKSMIIDRETKKVIWEYSGDYQGGISGGHESHMIEEGLPGAGNILIFDNGRVTHHKNSIIIEVNPTTKQVVWSYEDGKNFYSAAAGSVQRLPNGNTLISEDRKGRTFEVTPKGEIVWQLNNSLQTNRVSRYAYEYCSQITASLLKDDKVSLWDRFFN
jgi:hypothetical protein